MAGTGRQGTAGDGGPARSAELSGPVGLAVDAARNVFICDMHAGRVRKVSVNGIITTVAGGGAEEGADGRPATDAILRTPVALAFDARGGFFIAEQNKHRIRRVDAKGVITTVAGTGEAGFAGDGRAAVKAQLNAPVALAVDGEGTLFIADRGNHRIRKIDSKGIINTVAGGGHGGVTDGSAAVAVRLDPRGLAWDPAGNLLIADGSNRILKVLGVASRKPASGSQGPDGAAGEGGSPPEDAQSRP